MKRSTSSTLFGIALVVLFAVHDSRAQSTAPSGASKPDQVIQELLGEVRQLRIALQQISVNSYRSQLLVERLRLQQEQVDRLLQELNSTRNQLGEIRSTQVTAKLKLEESERGLEKGVMSPETALRDREVLEELKRGEQRLSEREVQVAAQLETECANLIDLNKRLDTLELELVVTGQADETKKPIKR